MNILEAKHKLYNYFINDSIFSTKDNYKDLNIVSKYDKKILEKILCEALNELEVASIVKKIDDDLWVLEEDLKTMPQSVQINYNVALSIAELIDDIRQSNPNFKACDPFIVNEQDLITLIMTLDTILRSK